MVEGQFLSTVRTIIDNTITDCNLQEYKIEYIIKKYSERLSNIKRSIEQNSMMNFRVKQKYLTVLNKVTLPPARVKHYDLVIIELRKNKLGIPSVIDFVKKN